MERISLSSDQSNDNLYPSWYNQRIRNNYQHLLDLLEKKKFIYNRAGDYYRKMNYYFVIPSILITTLSSIFAFSLCIVPNTRCAPLYPSSLKILSTFLT